VSTDLTVPRSSYDALMLCLDEHHGIHGSVCVRDIAAPIIAAELRLWTEYIEAYLPDDVPSIQTLLSDLRDRADELEAGR